MGESETKGGAWIPWMILVSFTDIVNGKLNEIKECTEPKYLMEASI